MIATAGLVGAIIFFNNVNIQIRMKEIKIFLQNSNKSDNNIDHIGLVMKYRLNRQLYDNRISTEKSNLVEMRVNAILSGRKTERVVEQEKYKLVSIPVLYAINLIRYTIGLDPIKNVKDNKSGIDLEVAYYYERNRKYEKAIELYDTILSSGDASRLLKGSVMVHQGFCYSVLGRYPEAKKKYSEVIRDYGDTSVAVTAVVLLRYLEGFKSEAERVMKHEKDSIAKGEKLFRLIAYRESFTILNKIEKRVSKSEKSRINLIKARVHEELDQSEKAVKLYQEIVMKYPDSKDARSANRRIYLIGALALNGKRIKILAEKNNQLLGDEIFSKMIEEEKKVSPHDNLEKNSMRSDFLKSIIEKNEINNPVFEAAELKTVDKLLKRVNRKILKEENLQKRIRGAAGKAPLKVKIYMRDGNIFTGYIISETATKLLLKTSIGNITVIKKKISRQIYF